MIHILYSAGPSAPQDEWAPPLGATLDRMGLAHVIAPDVAQEMADYIVYAPDSGLQDFTPFTRARAVLSLWAGVEAIVANPTLTMPLARMVGGGLTEGMVEWVTGHVLRHHLGMDRHIVNPDNDWTLRPPPLAAERRVTVLGLGALGSAVAQALARIGFNVSGWSRRPKQMPGISCYSGDSGLAEALRDAEFVILLLPGTRATENTLNRDTLALLARGAFVLNPGRGPLIDDAALIAALDEGQVAHATLDVFRREPLPQDHPFWGHPGVTVTPHVASHTRPQLGAEVIAENIRRSEAGAPLLHLVDRNAGY